MSGNFCERAEWISSDRSGTRGRIGVSDYLVCMALRIRLAIERPSAHIGQRIVLLHAYTSHISTACQRDTNLVIWSTEI